MTKLTPKSKLKIEPSNRDSISSWLDVLTSMLAVSESQRDQIRDELEDHLRSRVDDLLIVGKPEPEAIQIAVAELGETAELAKLITHAHTRTNPRRKIMNTALIAVALGGMSLGGFTFFNGTGAPSATPNKSGAVPVVVPGESRAESQPNEPTVELSIENMPILRAFDIIADAFGYTADIHSLDSVIASNLQRRNVTIVGEMTLARAIQTMKMQSFQHAAELTTEIRSDVLELLTQDEMLRRETTVKTYSIGWSNFENAENVAHTLQVVVGSGQYAQFFKMSFVADQVVVDARPQAHEQVEKILSKARLAYEALVLKEKTHRENTIARIKDEFDRVRTELIQKKTMMKELESRLGEMITGSNPDQQRLSSKVHSREVLEIEKALVDTELLHEEYQSRYNYLRDILIESEYAELFDGLSFSETSSQDAGTVVVHGVGMKAGEYQFVPGMQISRMLFIATSGSKVDPDRLVTLDRDGVRMTLGSVGSILSGEVDGGTLSVGDEIIISEADD